jgi:ATP-dependent DNA helicase RecQ
VVPVEYAHAGGVAAARYLKQAEFPLQCKKQVAPDAFQTYGFKGNLPLELRAETGRVLSIWDDAGWGHVVARDKRGGYFRDDLADAVAEMIVDRWRPEPPPAWVTCVPSLTHPNLVADLARRVAERLQLPFVAAVKKVKANEPQKRQQNRYHQCLNLDGVFEVAPYAPRGQVLLLTMFSTRAGP